MLKTIYDNLEDIPAGYEALYTERNGKWELTGVQGVKTQADVERVQEALRKEKLDHKAAKDALRPFEGLDVDALLSAQNELDETKAQLAAVKADGSIDEAKLEPIIAARVAQKIAPLERDLRNTAAKLTEKDKLLAEKDNEVGTLKSTITTGNVERSIRDAAIAAKMLPTAVNDAVLKGSRVFEVDDHNNVITKDNVGVTPGLSPKEWLKDEVERSPHWWPASVGGGSNGGTGGNGTTRANNPWSKGAWNMTKQGALVRELGEQKASEIAASVGSHIGATRPAEA